jgi:hypothetical protein
MHFGDHSDVVRRHENAKSMIGSGEWMNDWVWMVSLG